MSKWIIVWDSEYFRQPLYIALVPDGSQVNEYMDPRKATTFDTEDAAIAFYNEKIDSLASYLKPVKLYEAIKRFDASAAEGFYSGCRNVVDRTISRKYDPHKDTPIDVFNWWIAYKKDVATHGDGRVAMADYRSWPELYEVFRHIHGVGNVIDGRMIFTISTDKKASFEEFEREFELIRPHLDYKDDDGNFVINVLDHFLSEGGNSVKVLVRPDGSYAVEGRYSLHVEGDLKTVFEYLLKYRWYSSDFDDDD